MSSRQDAKNEKILRELLRLPENKRCPNCDSLGPQYVVSNFCVFVCTVCSGVHREFGHRVKGISMSTFKPEEIAALRAGGNGAFAASFLAKWSQTQLPKPTDRNVDRIKEWIREVYESKRFYDSTMRELSADATSRQPLGSEGKVVVRQLSEVLGSETPKLQVARTVSGEKQPSTQATPSHNNGHIMNLLDVSSPKVALSKVPADRAGSEAWDAFGSAKPISAGPATENGWAAFGEITDNTISSNQAAPVQINEVKQSSAPQVPSSEPWEAFGEQSTAIVAAPASPSPRVPSSVPQQQNAEQISQKKEERREVPLDIFFPEFEQIRATGLLPNGQPALVPLRPQGYAQAQSQQAYAQQPYHASVMGAGYPQQPAGNVMQAGVPRPSVVIPGTTVNPYGALPSPAGILSPASLTSPGSYGLPTYSSAGGLSPAGSTGSHQPHTNGSLYGHGEVAGLRTSVSSETSSTVAQQQSGADPFSSLAPGFKAALPMYGTVPARAAPAPLPPASPTPAGGLPSGTFNGGPPAGVGSPFGPSSLYSGPPSLSAMPYDLSAPAAPKARASGNPFA